MLRRNVPAHYLLPCLLHHVITAPQVHVPREGSAAAAAAAAQSFASRRRIGLQLLPDAAPFAGAAIEEAVPKLRAVQGRGMGPDGLPLDFTFSLLRLVSAQQLQAPGSGRFTRHVELQLPDSMTYTAGAAWLGCVSCWHVVAQEASVCSTQCACAHVRHSKSAL
jgi:hypothetical protein